MPILFRRDLLNYIRQTSKTLPRARSSFDSKKTTNEKIILRKSIFFIVVSFISIEFFFDIIYVSLRVIPMNLGIPQTILNQTAPWYFLLFVILNIVKILFMLIVAIRWITTFFEITPKEIRHIYGILGKNEKIYLCELTHEVTFSQSMVGRMFNYGTIEIYNPAIQDRIILNSIPNPEKYTEIIKNNIPAGTSLEFLG